eukprot:TRINITY_DN420_c4_g1_i1.p1 TRINITY_DN420_c4_g1~~TRINITY_DN420_c4_g1_i1.p1  ORF type:complete len:132 (-),score=56.81 TRINITY_DN420_c4_g1_i1:116-511(-)
MNNLLKFLVFSIFLSNLYLTVFAIKFENASCSQEGMYTPAKLVRYQCEEIGLCQTGCKEAICDVIDVLRIDCPEESQTTVELLAQALDDEYNNECGEGIGCLLPPIVSSASNFLEPFTTVLLITLTILANI